MTRAKNDKPTAPFRLVDISDLGVMHAVEDLADDGGAVTADELSRLLEVSLRSVTSRLSWMRHYELMERQGKAWRMTPEGEAILHGSLPKSLETLLEDMPDVRLVALTGRLANRQKRDVVRTAVRREWRHHEAQR